MLESALTRFELQPPSVAMGAKAATALAPKLAALTAKAEEMRRTVREILAKAGKSRKPAKKRSR